MRIKWIYKLNWASPEMQLELMVNPSDEHTIGRAFLNAKMHMEELVHSRVFLSKEEKHVVEMIVRGWWLDRRFIGDKLKMLSKFSTTMTKTFASFYSEWIRSLDWSVIRGTPLEEEFRMAVHELDKASEGLKPEAENMNRMHLWHKGAWEGPILFPEPLTQGMMLDIAQTTARSLLWEDSALVYASRCFHFGTGHLDNFANILNRHFPEPPPLP